MNVLGVAGLGSHKILEVFLTDLPEMVLTWYTYFGETAKALVHWSDPECFFMR